MLIILGITLVGALLFIYLFSIISKDRETDLEELELEEEELEDSMSKREFMKSLNFMLQMNIIDSMQYNDLLQKALPFLKG